jgi:hypothetical protein
MALFSSSLDIFHLLFASSPHPTIRSIDAMDLGADTCGLPPDFRPLPTAAGGQALRTAGGAARQFRAGNRPRDGETAPIDVPPTLISRAAEVIE